MNPDINPISSLTNIKTIMILQNNDKYQAKQIVYLTTNITF